MISTLLRRMQYILKHLCSFVTVWMASNHISFTKNPKVRLCCPMSYNLIIYVGLSCLNIPENRRKRTSKVELLKQHFDTTANHS